MITPAPSDFKISGRITFFAKAASPKNSERRFVIRLDICLDAVKFEVTEGVANDEANSLCHIAAAGKPRPEQVAQVGVLKSFSVDL